MCSNKLVGSTETAVCNVKDLDELHKKAEDYASGKLRKRPKELDLFIEEFKHLRKIRKTLRLEDQCAVNENWEICDWFGHEAWLRAKLDCMYLYEGEGATKGKTILKIIDHKTGKVREENVEQLDLYAVLGFILYEHIDLVEAEFWYLDQGEIRDETYTRDEALKLRKKWKKKTLKLLKDTAFKPAPSSKCSWCYFGKTGQAKKDGPGLCKF